MRKSLTIVGVLAAVAIVVAGVISTRYEFTTKDGVPQYRVDKWTGTACRLDSHPATRHLLECPSK